NEDTTVVGIKGYIGKPELSKKTRGEQYFFVNNRFIKSNYLHHAVASAYQQLIDKNYHPSYFIYLDIDPQRIDVNIHPTKTEIKFDDEKVIYSILLSAVRQAIGIHNISPSIDFERETSMDVLPLKKNQEVKFPSVNVNKNFNPFKREKTLSSFNPEAESEFIFEQETEQKELKFEADFGENSERKTNLFQIHNRYIVSQIKSGVIIVDQRQAHKRIVYEKIVKRINKQSIASQQLIFPVTLEFSASKFSLLKTIWDEVRSIGFDMEQFGNNTVVINGTPLEVSAENCDTIIKELIEKAAEGELHSKENFTENAAKLIADKSAVDKNKLLTTEEMEHVISELFSCENPYYTPNGKPTLKTFTTDDLNKMFD
ncbi:MAG: DNA mismatch repair endonuclease MutL, partial [Bacteroidia bacterium]